MQTMMPRQKPRGYMEPFAPASPVGELLRQYRARRNVSQTRLAALLGVDSSYISRLEQGTRTPSLAFYARLADLLELSPGERVRLLAAAGFPVYPDERPHGVALRPSEV